MEKYRIVIDKNKHKTIPELTKQLNLTRNQVDYICRKYNIICKKCNKGKPFGSVDKKKRKKRGGKKVGGAINNNIGNDNIGNDTINNNNQIGNDTINNNNQIENNLINIYKPNSDLSEYQRILNEHS